MSSYWIIILLILLLVAKFEDNLSITVTTDEIQIITVIWMNAAKESKMLQTHVHSSASLITL